MPIGDIAGEFLGGALRVLGNFVLEVVLEILVRGPGYRICRVFKQEVNADSGWVAAAGVAFWIVISVAGYHGYAYVSEAWAMDRCLGAGGTYKPQVGQCLRN